MACSPRSRISWGLVPVLFAVSACAGGSTSTPDPFLGADGGRNEVSVFVRNNNFYDARIYALVDGVRRSLGSVTGKTEGTFMMPLSFSQHMQLEINLLAGPTCRTESIPVDPGDMLQLEILSNPLGADFCR